MSDAQICCKITEKFVYSIIILYFCTIISLKTVIIMIKILQSSIFRAICAIIIGVLLIKYPDNTVQGITIAIGVLFLVSGIISCLTYFVARRHVTDYKIYDANGRLIAGQQPTFPIVGIGSIILGLILALMPTAIVSAIMYIVGIMLVLGAINQFMSLLAGRRYGSISFWFWVFPTVVLLVGLYVMLKPMSPANLAMYILGWCMLFYGVAELVNAIKLYTIRKKLAEQQPEFTEIEEVKSITE